MPSIVRRACCTASSAWPHMLDAWPEAELLELLTFSCCFRCLHLRSAAADGKFWDLLATWDTTDIPDLSGKVAIVTGPTAARLDQLKLETLC